MNIFPKSSCSVVKKYSARDTHGKWSQSCLFFSTDKKNIKLNIYKQLYAERGIQNINYLTDTNWLKIVKSVADVSARDIMFAQVQSAQFVCRTHLFLIFSIFGLQCTTAIWHVTSAAEFPAKPPSIQTGSRGFTEYKRCPSSHMCWSCLKLYNTEVEETATRPKSVLPEFCQLKPRPEPPAGISQCHLPATPCRLWLYCAVWRRRGLYGQLDVSWHWACDTCGRSCT